jgi:hypothetical protein
MSEDGSVPIRQMSVVGPETAESGLEKEVSSSDSSPYSARKNDLKKRARANRAKVLNELGVDLHQDAGNHTSTRLEKEVDGVLLGSGILRWIYNFFTGRTREKAVEALNDGLARAKRDVKQSRAALQAYSDEQNDVLIDILSRYETAREAARQFQEDRKECESLLADLQAKLKRVKIAEGEELDRMYVDYAPKVKGEKRLEPAQKKKSLRNEMLRERAKLMKDRRHLANDSNEMINLAASLQKQFYAQQERVKVADADLMGVDIRYNDFDSATQGVSCYDGTYDHVSQAVDISLRSCEDEISRQRQIRNLITRFQDQKRAEKSLPEDSSVQGFDDPSVDSEDYYSDRKKAHETMMENIGNDLSRLDHDIYDIDSD